MAVARGRRNFKVIQKCRKKIDGLRQCIHAQAGMLGARQAQDQWKVDEFFMEPRTHLPDNAMFAERQAVRGGEADQRVVKMVLLP